MSNKTLEARNTWPYPPSASLIPENTRAAATLPPTRFRSTGRTHAPPPLSPSVLHLFLHRWWCERKGCTDDRLRWRRPPHLVHGGRRGKRHSRPEDRHQIRRYYYFSSTPVSPGTYFDLSDWLPLRSVLITINLLCAPDCFLISICWCAK
jgi:hypothetical protein